MNPRELARALRTFLKTRSDLVTAGVIVFGLLIGAGCGPQADVLVPEATAKIKGVVLGPDLTKIPAAKVQLEPRGSAPCKFDTFTKVDGTYELEGICPGLYDIVATATINGVTLRCRLRFVKLTAGQTLLVPDLTLKSASTVNGRALLEGASNHSGTVAQLNGTDRQATTDATGAYSIANVEEGTYAMNFTHTGYITETITRIDVPAGSTVTVNVTPTLRILNPPATATLRGRVVLECRTDHAGIVVQVDGTDRSQVTTSGGYFVFDALPVSTYSLTCRKRYFFDKTAGPCTMGIGQTLVDVGQIQLDSHRLLNKTVQAFELEHSPNGTQLARATSADATVGEIALTDPTAQIFHQVLTEDAWMTPFAGLSWSPDGKDLLFVRSMAQPANTSTVGIVKSDGGGLRNLLPVANQYLMPTWAPDGNSFAYFLNPDIRTMTVDRSTGSVVATTSTSRVIDTLTGVVSMSGMEWSPTGRVYYSYNQNGASGLRSAGIFTVFSTSGGRLQITPRTAAGLTISAPESPTLRPDGNRIGFSWRYTPATGEPSNGLYIMDLDGVNATWITTVPGINLDWAPDSSRIKFTRPPDDTQYPNRIYEVLVPQ